MFLGEGRVSFGCDPEIFVRERKSGRFIGAAGLTRGTKQNPAPLAGTQVKVQVDGMALEFNPPPCFSRDRFSGYISEALHCIQLHLLEPDLELVIQSTVEFDEEEWKKTPEENKLLGCDPDWNAYTQRQNIPPNGDVSFRTGAGHISIGWVPRNKTITLDKDFIYVCSVVAKELDASIGLVSLLLDTDTKRRSLYGKAGAFRPKSWGMEYRTLSNFWIKNKRLTNFIFDNTIKTLERIFYRGSFKDLYQEQVDAQEIINTNDVVSASKFLERDVGLSWYTHLIPRGS